MAATTSIDGLISSMDTTSVINQLMSIEKQPQARLQARVTTDNTLLAALQDINTKLAALGTAASDLTRATTWQTMAATSSSPAVTARAGTGATAGQFSFDVTALAAAASRVSTGTVSATTASVASGPSITITKGTTSPVTTTINLTDTSLSGVITAINSSNAGVQAAAVQVAPSTYRLQLTSTTTGDASNFSVTGLDLIGNTQALVTGRDADVLVGGTSPGAYHITSATNSLTLMPGVTATLSQVATGVVVGVGLDASGVADKVSTLVDAANAALTAISQRTSFDSSTGQAGLLLGNSTVTTLQQQLLDSVSSALGGKSLSSAGIQLTKTGTLTFDRGQFTTAFTADPSATAALFQPGGAFAAAPGVSAGAVSFISAGDRTITGPFAVTVTQVATRAAATVSGTFAAGQQLAVALGAAPAVTYTTTAADTSAATLAANFNQFAATNSLGVTATVAGGNVVISANAYGSATTLAVTASGAGISASPVTAGRDVAGTINGAAATGNGQVLATASGASADRLALLVTASAADLTAAGGGTLGTFTFTAGLAQRMSTIVSRATGIADGTLTTAINGTNDEITDFTKQIADWDVRLAQRQDTLRAQFTAMETALGKLKDQSTWLAGQLSSLPTTK